MAYLRFQKSLSVLPGVRVNLSKSGPSVSVGPKGARVNVGPRGLRTTVSIPGSGLRFISQSAIEPTARRRQGKSVSKLINSVMDGMTGDQKREFFAQCVTESSLHDVKVQRDAFEEYLAQHAAEIEECDRVDIEQARRIYADAIETKEAEARRSIVTALTLAGAATAGMWGGVSTGSVWLIAGSLILILIAVCTEAGGRFLNLTQKIALGLLGLLIFALLIGFATVLILAISGHIH